jgi:hypothetical protein
MKKPRMTGVQMSHLGVLLWMEYKPSEIADEMHLIGWPTTRFLMIH